MRTLLAVLLLILIALQVKLWFGQGGYNGMQRLELRVAEQASENEKLNLRNLELQAEADDLRRGLQAVEERARSELGMIKENEEFYQVVPGKDVSGNEEEEPR